MSLRVRNRARAIAAFVIGIAILLLFVLRVGSEPHPASLAFARSAEPDPFAFQTFTERSANISYADAATHSRQSTSSITEIADSGQVSSETGALVGEAAPLKPEDVEEVEKLSANGFFVETVADGARRANGLAGGGSGSGAGGGGGGARAAAAQTADDTEAQDAQSGNERVSTAGRRDSSANAAGAATGPGGPSQSNNEAASAATSGPTNPKAAEHVFGEDISSEDPFTPPADDKKEEAIASSAAAPRVTNPEPASLLLLGTGLAVVARRFKRRATVNAIS